VDDFDGLTGHSIFAEKAGTYEIASTVHGVVSTFLVGRRFGTPRAARDEDPCADAEVGYRCDGPQGQVTFDLLFLAFHFAGAATARRPR
jgi:hypothetical protein